MNICRSKTGAILRCLQLEDWTMNIKQFLIVGPAMLALILAPTAPAETLVHETVVDAPVAVVWNAFTDADEISTWMVPKADIDLRIGGLLRTTYNPEADLDGPEAIHHRILAYEPQRMLAMRVVKCPDDFEFAALVEQCWQVSYFAPAGPQRTTIRAVGLGYGEGEKWDQMRAFFDQGNTWTYEQLREKFAAKRGNEQTDTPQQVMQLLSRLVGGNWIHESTRPDGGVFRVRNVLQHGPDGTSIVGKSWLGNEQGMFEHGSTQVYLDPLSQQVRFINIDEHSNIAEGPITLVDENTVEWDWRNRGADSAYSVLMTFTGKDNYEFTLRQRMADGSMNRLVHVVYDRFAETPERFLAEAKALESAK
jgi:uncharacterized protein YndB with AHSA1/START domain